MDSFDPAKYTCNSGIRATCEPQTISEEDYGIVGNSDDGRVTQAEVLQQVLKLERLIAYEEKLKLKDGSKGISKARSNNWKAREVGKARAVYVPPGLKIGRMMRQSRYVLRNHCRHQSPVQSKSLLRCFCCLNLGHFAKECHTWNLNFARSIPTNETTEYLIKGRMANLGMKFGILVLSLKHMLLATNPCLIVSRNL
ncbi:hypothetical protein L1987_27706 [Smallanthus sonchifolius]|uniref:Uncharacterized protein n=1 Tax=Smallanthus sonchifolius TaxID=185202 RepID=A0ACB9ICZ0_9ASTR|nr:hypothetical protein L1987_27706 [Smallanthus sonchifolius]